MIILNFSHPLTSDHLAQVEALAAEKVERVLEVSAGFDNERKFAEQVEVLVNAVGLMFQEWQTLPFLVNPPALNFIALALLAELHGRCGYFPTILRMRPVPGSTPPRFEVAELVNLQTVRDTAREREERRINSETTNRILGHSFARRRPIARTAGHLCPLKVYSFSEGVYRQQIKFDRKTVRGYRTSETEEN